jgi:folate-dependent phosphoribosylglycinamide formyltransferase PurN
MTTIVDNCHDGLINAEVAFVASDNPDAAGLHSARQKGVTTRVLPYSSQGRRDAERYLETLLEAIP